MTNRETRKEDRFIWTMVVIIALICAVGLYFALAG
jgi:uncharacterized membrane protein